MCTYFSRQAIIEFLTNASISPCAKICHGVDPKRIDSWGRSWQLGQKTNVHAGKRDSIPLLRPHRTSGTP